MPRMQDVVGILIVPELVERVIGNGDHTGFDINGIVLVRGGNGRHHMRQIVHKRIAVSYKIHMHHRRVRGKT
jgi:hypothetical protein